MIGGVHRTCAAELGGERETVSGAVARIARDGGPGPTSASVLRANGPRPGHARHVPRHGDTGHAHLGPDPPQIASHPGQEDSGSQMPEVDVCRLWDEGSFLISFTVRWSKDIVNHFVGVTTSVNISALVVGPAIPARIIQQWNFKKYPISNFALEILKSMKHELVSNIPDLNPGLFRKMEKLKHVALFRSQLLELARYSRHFIS